MPWISNHKPKIEEKSKSSRTSSKVVGLGLADLWEFPTLGVGRSMLVCRSVCRLVSVGRCRSAGVSVGVSGLVSGVGGSVSGWVGVGGWVLVSVGRSVSVGWSVGVGRFRSFGVCRSRHRQSVSVGRCWCVSVGVGVCRSVIQCRSVGVSVGWCRLMSVGQWCRCRCQ